MSVPWSAASALPRCAPTRKQARTPIDVTSSPPGTRDAKNQICQEQIPSRTSMNGPRVTNRKPFPAVRNCPAVRGSNQLSERRSSRPFYRRPVWAEPQADFSQIHLAYWRIVARDKPPVSRSFLAYDAMFVVLDEWQKAAICQNYRAKR